MLHFQTIGISEQKGVYSIEGGRERGKSGSLSEVPKQATYTHAHLYAVHIKQLYSNLLCLLVSNNRFFWSPHSYKRNCPRPSRDTPNRARLRIERGKPRGMFDGRVGACMRIGGRETRLSYTIPKQNYMYIHTVYTQYTHCTVHTLYSTHTVHTLYMHCILYMHMHCILYMHMHTLYKHTYCDFSAPLGLTSAYSSAYTTRIVWWAGEWVHVCITPWVGGRVTRISYTVPELNYMYMHAHCIIIHTLYTHCKVDFPACTIRSDQCYY